MSARSTLMRVHNRTPHTLTRKDADLDHGRWAGSNEPPEAIAAGQTVTIESESRGFVSGTEGSVRYLSDGGGELYLHWENPFLGWNSYEQAAPDGCGLCFSGGTGDNTELDVQLVPSTRVGLPGFAPSTSGFRFPNDWPKEPLLRVVDMPVPINDIQVGDASNGLCGGMAYAIADYYLAGRPAPAMTTNPVADDPLFDYIVDRLFDSFDLPDGVLTYWKYMAPLYPDTPRIDASGRSWIMAHRAFPAVMAAVDDGRPCPLGLVMVQSMLPTDLGHHHQVLAYAYQLEGGRATIWVYDPNSPMADDVTITFDLSRPSDKIDVDHNVNANGSIYAFFATNYSSHQPPPDPATP